MNPRRFAIDVFYPLFGLSIITLLSACASTLTPSPVVVLDFPANKSISVTPQTPQQSAQPPAIIPPKVVSAKPESTPPATDPLPTYGWPKVQRLPNNPANLALIEQDLGMAIGKPSMPPPAQPSTAATPSSTVSASENASTAPSATATQDSVTFSWPANGQLVKGNSADSKKGIEISGKIGDAVFAAAEGTVTYTGMGLRGYGKLIVIKHANNYLSVYAHNSAILVKEGQKVKRGEKIAEIGDTEATRPGLLFQLRQGKTTLDPKNYLPKR